MPVEAPVVFTGGRAAKVPAQELVGLLRGLELPVDPSLEERGGRQNQLASR